MNLRHLQPLAALVLLSGMAQAQSVSFTGTFTETFDSMGASGTTRPTGWSTWIAPSGSNSTWTTSITASSLAATGTTAGVLSATTTPSTASNNGFNAQGASSSDRVLATSPTSISGVASQLSLTNGTGGAVSSITVAYDTRRYTAASSANELPGYWLFYSLDGGTTWTNVSALNPAISGTSGVVVPNTVGVTSVAATTVNLSSVWAAGGTLLLRWVDDNAVATSPDQIIGLDNVVIGGGQPAPTVSLTAPANNSTTALPAPVNLVANASDANGTVAKVEFFQGSTKIGEATSSPFQYSWTGMISGSYTLTAKATDNDGASTTSAPVAITVTNPSNVAPTVAITSDFDGHKVPASSLVLTASASDSDGVVSKVEFFNGATKLGECTSAPYTITLPSVAVGNYAITAKATDNDGGTATSAVVNLQAVAYTDTTVLSRGAVWKYLDDGSNQGTAWKESVFDDTAWASGAARLGYGDTQVTALRQGPSGMTSSTKYITYYFRRTFTVADASKVIGLASTLQRDDGAVIYINGVEVARSNMNAGAFDYLTNSASIADGTDETTFFPLALPFASLVTGENTIAVEIHQRDSTSSDLGFDMDLTVVTEGGNARPVVQMTSPTNGSTSFLGNPIQLSADASDSDGTIAKVEFFNGATKIGQATSAPWQYTWSGVTAGTYSLTAVATDDLGSTGTSAAVGLTVSTGPSGTLQRGPYLNMANQNSIVVRWRSSQSVIGRVRYGLAPDALTQSTDETSAATDHEIRLTGLTPYTRYYYSVGSAQDALTPESSEVTSFKATGTAVPTAADYTFRTSPVPGTAVDTRIWIVGDCGRGTSTQAGGREAYESFTGQRIPDLNLQLGDNAYNNGTDAEYQTGYFNMYADYFRKMPQWSTLGNHDANNGVTNPATNFPYFDMFTFPKAGECGGVASGTEHYYSFDYGNIHFICLDSQASDTTVDNAATTGVNEDGPMAAWLRQDLASTTATWILAFWHHPPYSKGSHDSDSETQMVNMRTRFNPILEQGGVDMVFVGHSHNYERSFLLDGHYGTSGTITTAMKKNTGNGSTTGITTGASGVIRRAPNFTATTTTAGTVIPGDGAYKKPLTGPRDHFGTVYNTAGMSGLADAGSINHAAMYISYNTVGTVNIDINGNTLKATYVQSGGTTPDNYTIIKEGAADTDGDGIPDAYEMANGLNRYANDANATQDGDGVSNFLQFAFGLNPNVGGDTTPVDVNVGSHSLTKRGMPTTWYQATNNGTDFRVLFTRRKDYQEAGITYTPQFSADLVNWSGSTGTQEVVADGVDVEAVSIRYPLFVGGRKARFFRIQVSSNH
ncbi:MAG: Ig-like domain-containing protein [Luteolibacter sp.]